MCCEMTLAFYLLNDELKVLCLKKITFFEDVHVDNIGHPLFLGVGT